MKPLINIYVLAPGEILLPDRSNDKFFYVASNINLNSSYLNACSNSLIRFSTFLLKNWKKKLIDFFSCLELNSIEKTQGRWDSTQMNEPIAKVTV